MKNETVKWNNNDLASIKAAEKRKLSLENKGYILVKENVDTDECTLEYKFPTKQNWVFDKVNSRVVQANDFKNVFYTEDLTCSDDVINEVVELYNNSKEGQVLIGSGGIIDDYLLDCGGCSTEDRERIIQSIFLYLSPDGPVNFRTGDKVADLSGIEGVVIFSPHYPVLIRVAFGEDGKSDYRDLNPDQLTKIDKKQPRKGDFNGAPTNGDELDDFIQEIKNEFKDENWDYLTFVAERVRRKRITPTPTSKEGLTYKVECLDNSTAHYTHDKKEAYEVYAKFIIDFGDTIRLYEAPMPINDHDEIEWETIECYDADENDSKEGLEDGGFTKGEWDIAESKETHHTEYAIKSNGWHIAKLNPYAPENIHAEANARLIAAAPAMYEALKSVLSDLPFQPTKETYDKIEAILTRINKD